MIARKTGKKLYRKLMWFFLILYSSILQADPNCTNLGRLFYVGRNGTNTFWLSVSRARIQDAQLQGPLGQVVDNFSMFPNELHLSASPYFGTHSLFNIKNNGPCFIDSAQQTPRPPLLPDLPDPPDVEGPGDGGEIDIGGGIDGSGSGVLSQLLLNVNKNFLSTYLLRTYSVSDRVDNAFFRCSDEILKNRWQVWIEPQYVGLNSRIATGEPRSNSRSIQFGANYNVNNEFLVGFSTLCNNSNVDAFDGSLVNQNQGIIIGPFLGYRLDRMIINAWLIYGYHEIRSNLVSLSGGFHMHSFMASGNASITFNVNDNLIQPKLSLFYSNNETSKFTYSGIIPNLDIPVILRVGRTQFYYSHALFSTKLFREICLENAVLIPSLLAGVNNNFQRPDHGRVVNREIEVVSLSPWSGIVQTGLGLKLREVLRVDLLGGYYSIGVKEDLWSVGLTLTVDI